MYGGWVGFFPVGSVAGMGGCKVNVVTGTLRASVLMLAWGSAPQLYNDHGGQ